MDNNLTLVAEINLDATGVATYTSASLNEGTRTMWANYRGDDTYVVTSGSTPYRVLPIPASVTSLVVTSGGKVVASAAAGTAVTLTASVFSGGAPITSGQVNFCGSQVRCTASNRIGTAQLTSAGTATVSLTPGLGSHRYGATFLPTHSNLTSQSSTDSLLVTGGVLSTLALSSSGTAGDYSLQP